MLCHLILVLALAVAQIPAAKRKQHVQDTYEHVQSDIIENYYGNENSRIVSGWEAAPGQLPYFAALRLGTGSGGMHGCGGSLIAKTWVLTSAHCTRRVNSIIVRLGVVDMAHPEVITIGVEWYQHPSFNDNNGNMQPNALSLIFLHTSVTYTRLTQPIRLQSRQNAFANYNNIRLIASGHGATRTNGASVQNLRWVYLRGVSNQRCRNFYWGNYFNSNSICAGNFNVTSQNICSGDKGGPLVHVGNDGVPTLVGVAHFSPGPIWGNCQGGRPSVFIRPGPFHNWLTQVTGLDFENLVEEAEPEAPPTEATEKPAGPQDPELDSGEPELDSQEPDFGSQEPEIDTEEPEIDVEEPELDSGEPELDSEEPTIPTEPSTTATDPSTIITTEELITTTQAPPTEATEKPVDPQEPEIDTEEPEIDTEEPEIATEEPELDSGEPELDSEEPTIPTQPSTTATNPSTITTTVEPTTTTQAPPTEATEKPAGPQEPEIDTEEPEVDVEEPELDSGEPELDSEEPTIPTEPSTTATDPSTIMTTEEPTTTQAPTPTQKPDENASNEDSDSDDSSDSSEEADVDPELKDLLKRLEILVKVKVKLSKFGNKIGHRHKHNKTISRPTSRF